MAKKGAVGAQSEGSSPESKIDINKGKGKGKEGPKAKEKPEIKDGPPNYGIPLIHFDENDGLSLEDVSTDVSSLPHCALTTP